MKNLTALLILLIALSFQVEARPKNPLEHQIVSVRVTSQTWNEYRPWQKNKPRTRTFVGTVISGNRILMIADDLADATLIQVEKYDRPPRIPAQIIHIDHQIGLAIITVDDPEFFADLQPVEIAEDTSGEDYYCATWMSGQLSLAACRWSKTTVFNSSTPYFSYLGILFISDLSGGWGEPVFSGDQLIGLGISQREDRVTVLPVESIRAYLRAVEMDRYPGFAWLGINYQFNKGLAQSAYFGQQGTPRGVLVLSCFPGSSVDGPLQPNDILLKLDGHSIDSLGDYVHPRYGPVDLSLIATDGHYAGDTIDAVVLRNKKEITVSILLKASMPSSVLIPETRLDTPPPYLVAGGFVFRELDELYLKAWGKNWEENIPAYLRTLLHMQQEEASTPERKHLIVLADVFPDEYNMGYHDMAQNIVKSVNGFPIDSISKMEDALQHPEAGFHVIEFIPSYGINKVILDAEHFEEATRSIMEKYQIPSRIRTSGGNTH
ncbi:MAG: hypothetical protein V5783_10090 [Pontiella sp.]